MAHFYAITWTFLISLTWHDELTRRFIAGLHAIFFALVLQCFHGVNETEAKINI
jgi:hypothetical protein